MIDLLESIFQTHCPTRVDCKQLLLTLFNIEKRQQIVTEARKWFQTQALEGQLDVEAWVQEAMPEEELRPQRGGRDSQVGEKSLHLHSRTENRS